ncbi:MAG: GNAT family N-acetyltransferase [Marmoricola sp.]
MELREFTADDAAAISLAVELENAGNAVDCPWQHQVTPYRKEMEMRHGWDGEVGRHLLLYDGQTPVGGAELSTSEWDNRELVWLGLGIHPDHRRRGLGSGLVDRLLALSREMGRSLAGADGWESPGVEAFAQSTGFARKSQAIKRRMHLAEADLAEVRRLRDLAAAEAAPYELVRIAGRTPDELVEAVAELTAAINDAPTDDLEYEDEVYPPERIREYESAQIEGGHRFYRLVARHRETGDLGGHTIVVVDSEQQAHSEQHDTSVVRSHRGHRLGLLLKAEMVLWLAEEEPQMTSVDTWNAESNAHMIAVNVLLGYRVMGREIQFQRRF